ncbi:hypothetical protein CBL_11324 [Carabus blaptoides fortunei]
MFTMKSTSSFWAAKLGSSHYIMFAEDGTPEFQPEHTLSCLLLHHPVLPPFRPSDNIAVAEKAQPVPVTRHPVTISYVRINNTIHTRSIRLPANNSCGIGS